MGLAPRRSALRKNRRLSGTKVKLTRNDTLRGKAAVNPLCVKYWEIIAENLSKACGCISSTDDEGRQFWVVAAERDEGRRFIVRADDQLTAFVELERANSEPNVSLCLGWRPSISNRVLSQQ